MRIPIFLLALSLLSACGFATCGSPHEHQALSPIDTNKITNDTVKSAIEAWQNGNSQLWPSHFTSDAKLFDDGHPRKGVATNTTNRWNRINEPKQLRDVDGVRAGQDRDYGNADGGGPIRDFVGGAMEWTPPTS